jgi:four helix bundle protein
MSTGIDSYRDLLVWQQAMDLAVAIYELTRNWPQDERYGLTAQARRAASSVPANIAEGFGWESRAT